MDTRKLYYFVEICKRMSFAATAEALYISPQALSKSIQKLESDLGMPVFYRHKNNLSLTEFGKTLHLHALPLVEDFEKLRRDMKILGRQSKKNIRFAYIASLASYVSPKLLLSYWEKEPDTHLDIIELPNTEIEAAVADGRVDFAIGIGDEKEGGELITETLIRDEVALVLRRDNPLYKKKQIALTDLAGQTLISLCDLNVADQALRKKCLDLGICLNYMLSSPSVDLNKKIMHQIDCVSLNARSIVESYEFTNRVGYRLFCKKDKIDWNTILITSAERPMAPPVQDFIKHFKKQLGLV